MKNLSTRTMVTTNPRFLISIQTCFTRYHMKINMKTTFAISHDFKRSKQKQHAFHFFENNAYFKINLRIWNRKNKNHSPLKIVILNWFCVNNLDMAFFN